MKKSVKVLAVFGFTSAMALTTALGQGGPLITVDELGKGNINGNPLPSGTMVDPFSGIATLAYTLPFAGTPGDVVLLEPGPVPQQTSSAESIDLGGPSNGAIPSRTSFGVRNGVTSNFDASRS